MTIDNPYYLDPFQHITDVHFQSGLLSLACQLSSGVNTFDYTVPGDATIYNSANNLSGQYGKCTNTLTWVKPDGSKFISSIYSISRRDPEPPIPEPTLIINVDNSFRLVSDRHYVAVGIKSAYATSLVSQAHIQTDLEIIETIETPVDYIVFYVMNKITDGVRIDKYKTPYDTTLDQSLISLPVIADSVSYTSGTEMQFPITIEGTATRTNWLPYQNRILGCNKAGDKTIFFCDMKDTSGNFGNQYQILELNDNGTVMTITEHSVYYQTSIASGVAGFVYTGGDDWDDTSVFCSGQSYGDRTIIEASGGTLVQNYTESNDTTFLGVAYDKYTDEVLIFDKQILNQNIPMNSSYSLDMTYTHNFCTPNTINVDATNSCTATRNGNAKVVALRVNGINLIEVNHHYDETYNASGTLTQTGMTPAGIDFTEQTESFNYVDNQVIADLVDYEVVDLGAKLIAYRTTEDSYSVNLNSTIRDDMSGIRSGTKSEKTYIYANGIKTELESSDSAISKYFSGIPLIPNSIAQPDCTGTCTPAPFNSNWTRHKSRVYDANKSFVAPPPPPLPLF